MHLPSSALFSARVSAIGFPASVPTPPAILRFSDSALAHALFTTGRAPGDQAAYGMASVYEFIHRASLMPAYVRRHSVTGRLLRSRLALDLDRSEKTALSYSLGQAITSIFCRSVLSTSHLMHVDRYAKHHWIAFAATKQRPDLFGPSPAGWVVAEAKGRSNAMETGLRFKMQAQKRAVKTIAGAPPGVAVGCVASFPPAPGRRVLQVDAFDPDAHEDDAIALDEIDEDRLMVAYYAPFIAAIDWAEGTQASVLDVGTVDRPTQDQRVSRDQDVPVRDVDRTGVEPIQARTVSLLGEDVRVGLLGTVEDRVRLALEGQIENLAADVANALARLRDDRFFPDGSIVVADWSDAFGRADVDEG